MKMFGINPVQASTAYQQTQNGGQLGGFEGFRIPPFGVRGRGGS
jgi:hypothetical protein